VGKSPRLIRFLCLLYLLAPLRFTAKAQSACRGRVMEEPGGALGHALLTAREPGSGKLMAFTFTNTEGYFLINLPPLGRSGVVLRADFLDHDPDSLLWAGEGNSKDLLFHLKRKAVSMDPVRIRAGDKGIRSRGDTLEFTASRYAGPEVRKVEDLISKMEGFVVSPDGKISFNGQELEKILVNGEDMTGRNYRLLSRNLRSGLIAKVQLIRNYNDDRLLREASPSGKVGVNLSIADSLLDRLTGGVEAGAA